MAVSPEKPEKIDTDLPIEDARRLLQAIAEEEYPQETFDWQTIKLVCSHPDHQHNNFDGSLGLSLSQANKPRPERPLLWVLRLRAARTRSLPVRLSAPTRSPGRRQRAGEIYFFEQRNAARILHEFEKSGTCRLGWASWKAQNQLQTPETVREADVSRLKRTSRRESASP